MKQIRISKQITNRESESLDKYLQEIGKVNLLTIEEEVKLAQSIREGDISALEKLTKANLRFVVSVAKQYQNRGLPLSDLINEGNVGLIKAGQRFDETRGFKFISYAVWWIRQSIIQALAEHARVVRIPLNRVGSVNKILKIYSELEQHLQRDPTNEELADKMDTTAESVRDIFRISQKSISTDAPIQADEHVSLMDTLPDKNSLSPDAVLMDTGLKSEITDLLSILSAREMEVVVLYYGLNNRQALTLEEIADRFAISRERVRQIKDKATRELRGSRHNKGLKYYLG